MNFIKKILKAGLTLVLILLALILTLNYSSHYYRYPAFKWLSSLVEDNYVVKKIDGIELQANGFSNQIRLKGIEIYSKKIGEKYAVRIDEVQGTLDLINFFRQGVLFKNIKISNIKTNYETLLGILVGQEGFFRFEINKYLKLHFPDKFEFIDQQPNYSKDFVKNLALNPKSLQRITQQIELENSKLIIGDNEINLTTAKLFLDKEQSKIEAEIGINQDSNFQIDLSFIPNQSKMKFAVHQLPLSDFIFLSKNQDLTFLEHNFSLNVMGYFDYKKMVVQLDNFDLISSILNINGAAKYSHQANQNLKIAANITKPVEAKNFYQFWPKYLFAEKINDWLASAFTKGLIHKTDFQFDASLNEFDQLHSKELFQFDIETKDLSLNFLPDWQELSGLKAKIKVTNLGIEIITFSENEDIQSMKTTSNIDFFEENPVLNMKIDLVSKNDFISQFIKNNPLNQSTKLQPIVNFALKGDVKSAISLHIPLNEKDEVQFSGTAEMIDNYIEIDDLLKIHQINGKVKFDNHNVSSKFTASWLNNLMKVEFKNLNEKQLEVNFDLSVTAKPTMHQLFDYFSVMNGKKIIDQIAGQTTILGKIIATDHTSKKISSETNHALDSLNQFDLNISLSSSLKGLSMNIFTPLIKEKKDTTPLEVTISYEAGDISLQSLKFNEEINIAKIKGLDETFVDVSIVNLNLDSKKIATLFEDKVKSLDEKLTQTALHQYSIPNMDITIYRLKLDNLDIGSLSMKLKNNQEQIKLDDIEIKNTLIKLSGNFISNRLKSNLSLKSTISKPLDNYFNFLDIKPITTGAPSKVSLNLSWPGQIWDYENKDTSGNLNIVTESGVLTIDRNASFFARLIKELSLSSIRDRLNNLLSLNKIFESLNPTTVFKEGIEFDQLNLAFNFNENKIFAEKVDFKSESIDISFSGYTDLNDQSLHHQAIVKPDILKMLPVIGLFSANIPVTIIGLISERFIDTKDFFKMTYEVIGNINNPQIKLKLDNQTNSQ